MLKAPTASSTQVFSETASKEIEEESLKSCQRKEHGPGQWKQNVMKHHRDLGQEYTMRNNKVATVKSIGDYCYCKSKGKGCSLLSENDWLLIFKHMRTLSWNEKRNLVHGLIDKEDINCKRSVNGQKNRDCTFRYHLKMNQQKKSLPKDVSKHHWFDPCFRNEYVQHGEGSRSL